MSRSTCSRLICDHGLRARRETDLPPLRLVIAALPVPTPTMAQVLGRLDTLILAGLDSEARSEVRYILANAPDGHDSFFGVPKVVE